MGKAIKTCFIQMDISEIVKLLAFDDSGRTSFALYSQSGTNLSDTELGPVIAKRNFFDALHGVVPESVWNEQYENFRREAAGSLTFDSGDAEETLYYMPIRGTGWEMVVLIRESVIQNRIRDISERSRVTSQNQTLFTLVSVLILAIILLWESTQVSKNKIAEEQEASKAFQQMANTDALTGAGSKNAYNEREADINQLIADYDMQELAVVVCDINGLKHVNDTQGHAAGDQLIKDACALIRAYFPKGDVYRVGGDEFVVLLQGEGYASLSEDAAALNREVEAHIETGEVVVSIGWSVLGEADPQLRAAFERADQMMYERKEALKEMGAHGRH
jgi:diguanylate cyclase (GGDEF)-like protein